VAETEISPFQASPLLLSRAGAHLDPPESFAMTTTSLTAPSVATLSAFADDRGMRSRSTPLPWPRPPFSNWPLFTLGPESCQPAAKKGRGANAIVLLFFHLLCSSRQCIFLITWLFWSKRRDFPRRPTAMP